jgi:SGNH hydrolase-like domain, acetyltransferase AlgX
VSAAVAGSQIEVAEGKGGWLFLRRYEDVEPLRWGADLSAWKETHLPALTAQFAGRRARLAAHGIAYVVAVVPEKGSVYPEELPPGHSIAAPTAAELLTDACVSAQVEAVDLMSLLRSAKGPLDIYSRVDSHWTFFGAYLGYRAITEAVGKTCPIPVLGPHEISYSDKEGFGDLGVHLTPERRGRVQQVDVKAGMVTTVSDAYDERERVMAVHTCERGRGKALVLRDSFSSFLAPYLSRTFAETTYVAPSLAMLDDMIGELKPDIVLHQCSERSLFYSPRGWEDWEPRTWRQIYLEVHQYPQHVRLIRPLRQALREWRFEDAVLLGRQLADVTSGELDHNLAEALVMSGAHASALQASLRAEAACGAGPFTSYLKAVAQRALGHKGEALASLNEALAARPGHAWFLFMLGAWLLEDGNALVAAPILQSAADQAPALMEGWRKLSEAYALLGNGPEAASARRRADRLAGAAQDPKLEISAAQGQGS